MDQSFLTCPVCLDLTTDPHESNCCNQLFCFACIQSLQICPMCRANDFTYHENKAVARILDAFPATCPFECGTAVTRGNLEAHTKTCEKRIFDCPAPTCMHVSFKGRVGFLNHIVTKHADDVDKAFQLYYATKKQKCTALNSVGVETAESASSRAYNFVSSWIDVGPSRPLNAVAPSQPPVVVPFPLPVVVPSQPPAISSQPRTSWAQLLRPRQRDTDSPQSYTGRWRGYYTRNGFDQQYPMYMDLSFTSVTQEERHILIMRFHGTSKEDNLPQDTIQLGQVGLDGTVEFVSGWNKQWKYWGNIRENIMDGTWGKSSIGHGKFWLKKFL